MKNSPIAKIAAATAALGFAAVAMAPAAVAQDTVTVKVHYSPTELMTEDGLKNVVDRIHESAKEACGHRTGNVPIEEVVKVRRCTKVALTDALEQIQRPQLADALEQSLG